MKNIKLLNLAIISVLISIALHIYLTSHHYSVYFGTEMGSAICNINEKLNCDSVAASKYASLFGIPLALLGVLTHLALFVFLVSARYEMSSQQKTVIRIASLMTLFIFFMSILMGSISLFKLNTLCLFCIGTYIFSLITLILTSISLPGCLSFSGLVNDLKPLFGDQKWILTLLILIPISSILMDKIFIDSLGGQAMKDRLPGIIAEWSSSKEFNFDLNRGLILNNHPNSKMTVVEFADFRCSHCKHASPSIEAFVKSHPDVKFVFKVFALDGTCNKDPVFGGRGDGISCELGFITHCADKIGKKGWQVHHHLFENQIEIAKLGRLDSVYDDICKLTGLNCEQLKSCTKSPEAFEEIRLQSQEGNNAGVAGTPTVYVNGKKLNMGQLIPVLSETYKWIHSEN